MESVDQQLLNIVLPVGILDYFKVIKVVQTTEQIDIHLEELNIIPEEFVNERLISKGFFEEIRVHDFPIRGKGVYLLVKRRRWINETSGNIVCRNWNYVSKGTRMTKEFASFLKVIARY